MTSVLFLDFDGVLNSHRFLIKITKEGLLRNELDPDAVERLNMIVDRTGCKVVVSSSWRILHPIDELQKSLEAVGFKHKLLDTTPHLGKHRGIEIQAWLDDHGPFDAFAIVDDDSDMDGVMDKLVKTSLYTGLMPEHVEALIALLGEKK